MFKKHDSDDPTSDFLFLYNDVKCSFAKTLLVLFYVSHIVVLNHPDCNFDINYIQYFKALDSLRFVEYHFRSESKTNIMYF